MTVVLVLRPLLRKCPRAAWRAFLSTAARDQPFIESGWLDERGLTQFDTLHELQTRSCAVFETNTLYGTYQHDKGEFDYETYGDFGNQVDKARQVLKHLGMWL